MSVAIEKMSQQKCLLFVTYSVFATVPVSVKFQATNLICFIQF